MRERDDFKWIVICGSLLSIHSGFINAVGMKSVFQLTVTHLTGLVTKAAFSVVDHNWPVVWQACYIIISFWLGAFLTGAICGTTTFRPQPRYGLILMMEGVCLLISVAIFHGQKYPEPLSRYAFSLVSFGTGLQNAMFATYSGAVIRTSHLTGMVNDSAMLLGQWTRYRFFVKKKKQPEMWRLRVFIPILSSFICGAMIGTAVFDRISYYALLFPGISIFLIGATYLVGFKIYQKYYSTSIQAAPDSPTSNGSSNGDSKHGEETEDEGAHMVELEDEKDSEKSEFGIEDSPKTEIS